MSLGTLQERVHPGAGDSRGARDLGGGHGAGGEQCRGAVELIHGDRARAAPDFAASGLLGVEGVLGLLRSRSIAAIAAMVL